VGSFAGSPQRLSQRERDILKRKNGKIPSPSKSQDPDEKIKVSLFIGSDRDDRTGPWSEFCKKIVRNLRDRHFQYDEKHI
jgi:hypothetical protein